MGEIEISVDMSGSAVTIPALPPGLYTGVFQALFLDSSATVTLSQPAVVVWEI